MISAQNTDLLIIIAIVAGMAAVVVWVTSMGSVALPMPGSPVSMQVTATAARV